MCVDRRLQQLVDSTEQALQRAQHSGAAAQMQAQMLVSQMGMRLCFSRLIFSSHRQAYGLNVVCAAEQESVVRDLKRQLAALKTGMHPSRLAVSAKHKGVYARVCV
jgi:hypothetical protein